MKNQALFSPKEKSKKLKCRLLQFLSGALRVKVSPYTCRGSKSTILQPFTAKVNSERKEFAPLGVNSLL